MDKTKSIQRLTSFIKSINEMIEKYSDDTTQVEEFIKNKSVFEKELRRLQKEQYVFLLENFDFRWQMSDDRRFEQSNLEKEKKIEHLRLAIDEDNKIYNSYSPFKK